jgi:hypothetical protein
VYNGSVFAQDDFMTPLGGGTLRGTIEDTTPNENPVPEVMVKIVATDGTIIEATSDSSGEWVVTNIPAGRYLVSIYRQGYGSREGKRVTVLPGGDQELRLKMTKKDTIILGPNFWLFALGFITAIPIAFITGFLIATKLLNRRGV